MLSKIYIIILKTISHIWYNTLPIRVNMYTFLVTLLVKLFVHIIHVNKIESYDICYRNLMLNKNYN